MECILTTSCYWLVVFLWKAWVGGIFHVTENHPDHAADHMQRNLICWLLATACYYFLHLQNERPANLCRSIAADISEPVRFFSYFGVDFSWRQDTSPVSYKKPALLDVKLALLLHDDQKIHADQWTVTFQVSSLSNLNTSKIKPKFILISMSFTFKMWRLNFNNIWKSTWTIL